MNNLPAGTTEVDIDRAHGFDEPEYELTEADLEEAYLESLELSAPVNCFEDVLLIDAALEEKRMERWAA